MRTVPQVLKILKAFTDSQIDELRKTNWASYGLITSYLCI